jgi:hypothetical protein
MVIRRPMVGRARGEEGQGVAWGGTEGGREGQESSQTQDTKQWKNKGYKTKGNFKSRSIMLLSFVLGKVVPF